MSPEKLLLVLPCYNEADSLPKLLPEVLKLYPARQVLVVDDGSVDGTAAVARAFGVHCVSLVRNCGIGGAVQTGFLFAVRNGFEAAVQVDGDGQHPPDQIARMLEGVDGADLVIGSRFVGEKSFQSSFLRRGGIRLISGVLRILFGLRAKDVTSGLRLYGPRALKLFADSYPMDYPEPLALALAHEAGLRVKEVPVIMRERLGGRSSILGVNTIRYMVRVIGNLILLRMGRYFR